ncbi:alpha/beta fold hydrolase [Paucibacter sp. PLA-PC-4]|uniref:alpha/beta fold hydrolase n=1 Tax=Paucibacter sp. PLA-PC-4 TaxID=2993655 RepID=UPI0022493A65|nr:alpha/beta fold hydrolase [Paucibacter sp. PLA-PC-4]MCX2861749.1 alpha/beta fold hydrolase [Paucibacter sp. PLA-PC-4]
MNANDTAIGTEALIGTLEASAQRHQVPFEGGHVAWRCFGTGPALVLLHGGHGSWLHWARNIPALAARHTVWVPDLPGFGASSRPSATSLEGLVEAIVMTLDALIGGRAPVMLVGFSFGGLVAAAAAARRGAVSKLALLGPAGHGGVRRPRGELRSWREAAERRDDAALDDVMRHNLTMHMLHEPADALAVRIHRQSCLATRFRSKAISRAAGLNGWLAHCAGPLLLVWGEHDVTAVPAQAGCAVVEACAPQRSCQVQVIAGAGHWVQYERAETVNSLLLAWLADSK